ncbi:MAG TPA: serine hydrolase domain-containing protein, partial [Acidobacteriota bacterium]|nr:serine hydrolase domain-containing protein [Acidobacteriota bacterium]
MTAHRKTTIFTAVLFVSWTLAGAEAARDAAKAPTAPPGLDAAVSRALLAFEVPGAALAVVKDGRVVVAKGYGVRRLGEPAAVDAKTLFGIASNTKVFTAVALGTLVEDGKL